MKKNGTHLGLVVLLLCVLPLSACINFGGTEPEETPAPPQSMYLDFEDVRIPAAMERVRDKSFMYESTGIKAGVIALSGDADLIEVLDFFQKNMAGDGWVMMSSFKYRQNILLYTKPDKVCLIMVDNPASGGNLNMEIWVSPMLNGNFGPSNASGNQFKPLTDKIPLLKSGQPVEENLKDFGESS